MNWQEKLSTLQQIAGVSLRMRKPGDWYVAAGMEISHGGMLTGEYGNGKSPSEAVLQHWKKYTRPDLVIVVRDKRYTWVGHRFMQISNDARGAA